MREKNKVLIKRKKMLFILILIVVVAIIGLFTILRTNKSNNKIVSNDSVDKVDINIEDESDSTILEEETKIETEKTKEEKSQTTQSTETKKESNKDNNVKVNTNTNSKTNSTNQQTTTKQEQPKQEQVQEQPKQEQPKPVEPQPVQTETPKPKTCGIYQSITNCKYDYDSSSACYSAGDKLTEMYLNDWMDYNDANPNNPISREIQNTDCYSVDTDNGVKWYLLVVCYGGSCSKNYKSIYLGK